MITGFNTEIEHEGRVFHVQTEDKGLDDPRVETLVYCGGEIVTCQRSSYAELTANGGYSEEQVHQRMEAQHQQTIDEIRQGVTQTGPLLPFGHALVTDRTFDEVVCAWLLEQAAPEPIRLKLLDWQVLREGTRPTVRLSVQEESTLTPVVDALVTVRLINGDERGTELFSAATDRDGFVEASFHIPEPVELGAEIVFDALKDHVGAELKKKIKRG